ncbi:RagB/SusD family nutrient uptake outer membrane protein [Chryseobacterium chendengshani]|uniref:RagB/SusD family nutrient uptake outer membrane protein n=1 Tax=Chryseobacterium sp. LJ756 TaxID=2864113 RepID=UPI001C63F6DF|nr:RagB/SusD family nutrient uptake outer membrane protein [Chryseobacterium sp. LJ756]MBW7674211.1 RagB/SusD family nutrient uptake outer membrane protein [Chryseobacterium sp. LJ756]
MKNLHKQYIITLTLGICLSMISCENLVEVEDPTNQISASLVFEDIQTANAALAGVYAGLWEDSPLSGGAKGSGPLLGIYADDLENFASSITNAEYDLYQNIHIDNNSAVLAYWTSAYQKVYQFNAILEGIEASSGINPQNKERLKGEALAIRSILFFYLQQTFGNIPYPVTTDYQINQTIPRIPSGEVLERLENDLKESITLLSDQYREPERIVLNRKAAEFMLAKVLMTQGKWSEAEVLLKGIIADPQYQFENDLSKVFLKAGKHILWQLKPKNAVDPTKESTLYYFVNSAPSIHALSNNLMNSFTAGDLRKTQWITGVTFNQVTRFRSSKYKAISNNSTEYSIVFRLEEVYLLLAESLANQDKMSEAIPWINQTRQRAGLPALPLTLSKQQALTEITAESRKEFFTEMGNRFMHLKRRNHLSELISSKPNFKTYHQLWPVPIKELLLNKNLYPQNEGY